MWKPTIAINGINAKIKPVSMSQYINYKNPTAVFSDSKLFNLKLDPIY